MGTKMARKYACLQFWISKVQFFAPKARGVTAIGDMPIHVPQAIGSLKEGIYAMVLDVTKGSPANEDTSREEERGRVRDWKLKDCDPDAIKVAKASAKANGLRISAWVSKVIHDAASNDSAVQVATGSDHWRQKILRDLDLKLAEYDQKIVEHQDAAMKKLDEVRDDLRVITLGLLPKVK